MQIKTFTLDPSFKGLRTTGNFNRLSIILINSDFDLLKVYKIYLGVKILFFIKVFLIIPYPSQLLKQLLLNAYKEL